MKTIYNGDYGNREGSKPWDSYTLFPPTWCWCRCQAGARPVPYPAPVLRGAGAENLAPARPWWKSSISAHRARPLLVLCLKAFIVLMELKPCLLAVTSWEWVVDLNVKSDDVKLYKGCEGDSTYRTQCLFHLFDWLLDSSQNCDKLSSVRKS